ncbi:hypothetical protein EZJ58_1320 [Sodalis ligni]|jgi:hypothetical protein|uniref:Uncharacterized protein n=1 Tax=Sodalis ligni TaxID=2697027 RepID=A0A4R1N9F1_9GAMM|nr:hypothetical protein EZJ58_1320 [Sodalis ligni]
MPVPTGYIVNEREGDIPVSLERLIPLSIP